MDQVGPSYGVSNYSEVISSQTITDNNIETLSMDTRQSASWEPPTLPSYITIYVTVVNIIIFLAGTTGNVMVIVVVARVRDMRSSINLYLVNLSIADLLVLFVCQPAALLEFYAKERWYLGQELCVIIPVLEHTVLHASTLTVVFITFERYLAICRPHSHIHLSCKGGFWIKTSCIWLGAGLTSLPFVDMTNVEMSTFYDGSACDVCLTVLSKAWHNYYVVSANITFGVLPVIMLVCFYGPIICRLRSRLWLNRESGRVSRALDDNTTTGSGRLERSAAMFSRGYRLRTHGQVIRMLLIIVAFLFLSLVPMRVLALWQVLGPPRVLLNLGIEYYNNIIWLCRMLMYTNSAVNPLIYALLSTRFKIAFRLVLRCQTHILDSSIQNRMSRRTALRLVVRAASSTGSGSYQQP